MERSPSVNRCVLRNGDQQTELEFLKASHYHRAILVAPEAEIARKMREPSSATGPAERSQPVRVNKSVVAMPTVKFVNEKVTVQVQDGEDLRSVARKNGVEIYSGPHKIVNCMGFGTCCSCNVIIRSGEKNCSRKGILESVWKWLNPLLGLKILSNADKDVRLACQTRVHGDVEVETHPPINWHGEKYWS